MRIRTKICGITDATGLDAAAAAGADAVGFVFARSPRRIAVDEARALAARLPPWVAVVAVMRHPETELARIVLGGLAPDWLQTDADDFADIDLPAGCRPLPVLRENAAGGTLPAACVYEGRDSGTGRTVDWDRAEQLARCTRMVLAGGLAPANVAEAVRRVRPWAVDVSSGVETAPGVKSPELIEQFLASVRGVERELENET